MKKIFLFTFLILGFVLSGCTFLTPEEKELIKLQKQLYDYAIDAGYGGTFSEFKEILDEDQGIPGDNVVITLNDGYIKWKNFDEEIWYNLVSINQIINNGNREVVFKIENDNIYWRFESETDWYTLIDITMLIGEYSGDGLGTYANYKEHFPNYPKDQMGWLSDYIAGKLSTLDDK